MFDPASLLPPNRTPSELAVELATARLGELPVAVSDLWNPQTCPPELLGWLAWSLSVDDWQAGWPDAVKREVLAHSVHVHRRKGTRGAVEDALTALGFRLQISEWFEYGGEPHRFRVDAYHTDVARAGFQVDPEFLNQIRRYIQNVKPARSHFDLRIGLSWSARPMVRSGTRARQRSRGTQVLRVATHTTASAVRFWGQATAAQKSGETHRISVRPVRAGTTTPAPVRSGFRLRSRSQGVQSFRLPVIRAQSTTALPVASALRAHQISRHTVHMQVRSA